MGTEKLFCTCGHSFNTHRDGCGAYPCGCSQFERDPNQVPYEPDRFITHIVEDAMKKPEMLSLSKALDLLERAHNTGVFAGPGALGLDDQIGDFLVEHGRTE